MSHSSKNHMNSYGDISLARPTRHARPTCRPTPPAWPARLARPTRSTRPTRSNHSTRQKRLGIFLLRPPPRRRDNDVMFIDRGGGKAMVFGPIPLPTFPALSLPSLLLAIVLRLWYYISLFRSLLSCLVVSTLAVAAQRFSC